MIAAVNIAGRNAGTVYSGLVIAEAEINHNGDIELARRLVDVAADAGADAVKFQTFVAERVIARNAPKAEYQIETTGACESQLDMVKRLELPLCSPRPARTPLRSQVTAQLSMWVQLKGWWGRKFACTKEQFSATPPPTPLARAGCCS